jgi:hypothetical protein
MTLRERFAQQLLVWTWRGVQLEASISRCAYYVRASGRYEVLAWAEVCDVGGRYRIEIGSFPSVAAARAVCEADAQRRCAREQEERPPVSVAIGRVRGGAPRGNRNAAKYKAGKGRELPGGNYRPRDPVVARDLREGLAAFDAALAAFADVVGDEG